MDTVSECILRGLLKFFAHCLKKISKFLRATTPSDGFDRNYVESFVDRHRNVIRGDVLEFNGRVLYSPKFEDVNEITLVSWMNDKDKHPDSQFFIDLEDAETFPRHKLFDCIIMTQVLNSLTDAELALKNISSLLKPSGYLIVTVSGPLYQDFPGSEYKQFFTKEGFSLLLRKALPHPLADLKSYGDFEHSLYSLLGTKKPNFSSEKATEFSIIIGALYKNVETGI